MNDRRLANLPLYALRAFEAAGRLGSFKMAARELGVTPAAISHQVKALEAHLGLLLFERLHRALKLTREGTRLSVAAQKAFQGLGQALTDLADQDLLAGPFTLNVTAAPSIAAKWLAPRLHRFQASFPRIELRLDASDKPADLARDPGMDVALRYGAGAYGKGLSARRLWPAGKVVAVCAPALLKANVMAEPRDVLAYPLLRTAQPNPADLEPDHHDRLSWRAWLEAAGVEGDAPPSYRFSNTQLALEAAVAGRGFALTPAVLVADDMQAGRLVQPFPISLDDPFSYWLLHRSDRTEEAPIRAFSRWIGEEASQTSAL